jgi:hypothetical protein
MPSKDASHRKRNSGTDEHNPKNSKARRVSTDASASATASLQVDTSVVSENTASTATVAPAKHESIKSVGKMIQDLFHSDNAKVDAALDALNLDLDEDEKKCESLVAAGVCFALVHLMQNSLDKAIDGISACDQVAELNELTELTTLDKTLDVVINLTFNNHESRVGITAVGGVEAVVMVMKTLPKCPAAQEAACTALGNLACCNIGKAKAIESGGVEVVLAAINNHLHNWTYQSSLCHGFDVCLSVSLSLCLSVRHAAFCIWNLNFTHWLTRACVLYLSLP